MNLFHRYSRFIGDVATLATGRGASMAIKLALTPLIARLFNPSDFGVMAFFGSLVAMGSAFATLRYERAIVLAPDEAEAGRLAQLTYAVLDISAVLIMAVAIAVLLLNIQAEPFIRLGAWVLAVPIALALMGVLQILEGVLSRRGKFAVGVDDVKVEAVTNHAFKHRLQRTGHQAGLRPHAQLRNVDIVRIANLQACQLRLCRYFVQQVIRAYVD